MPAGWGRCSCYRGTMSIVVVPLDPVVYKAVLPITVRLANDLTGISIICVRSSNSMKSGTHWIRSHGSISGLQNLYNYAVHPSRLGGLAPVTAVVKVILCAWVINPLLSTFAGGYASLIPSMPHFIANGYRRAVDVRMWSGWFVLCREGGR